jgi:hypothetical protein
MAWFIEIQKLSEPRTSAQIEIYNYLTRYNHIILADYDLQTHIDGMLNYSRKKVFGSASKLDKPLNVTFNGYDETVKYVEAKFVNVRFLKVKR